MKEILGVKLYTVQEVGDLLNLTRGTVRNYIHDGRLVSQKIGGRFMVTEGNLTAFLNSSVQAKSKED